jgi:pimeloyl-ACP methyl ester carboxylesterase
MAILAAAVLWGCESGVARERFGSTKRVAGPIGELYVDDGGTNGLPVVFVHSFAGSTEHWSNQLEHLRRTRRAVALDLRGHGLSDAPPDTAAYQVRDFAADIGAVVDSLRLDRFVLVGHSQGGSAALRYAAAHPDRVAGLVMIGTPGKTPPQMAHQVLAALQKDYDTTMEQYWNKLLQGARPDVLSRIERERSRIKPDAAMAIIGALFAYDPTADLRAYTGPKLIIDSPAPETPGSLHALAPDAPRKVVNDASHWVQLDKPDEVNQYLDEFVARIETANQTAKQE